MKLIYYYLSKSVELNRQLKKKKRFWEIIVYDIFIYRVPNKNQIFFNKKLKSNFLEISIIDSFFMENENLPDKGPDIYNIYLHIYQQYYISQLIKTPAVFKSINIQDIIPSEQLSYMMYSVRSIKWKKFYITHSNEIIEMLFLCLWLKNINLFIKWARKHFEKNNLKKHKKIFLLFKYLLGSFIWNHNLLFRLKGVRFVLRGKFGKAGSVRKSRKYIKRGKCSYTSKNIALMNQTKVIRTTTGVFSIKLEIFF